MGTRAHSLVDEMGRDSFALVQQIQSVPVMQPVGRGN